KFCAAPPISSSCATTGDPSIPFPQSYIRDIRHAMHTYATGANFNVADIEFVDSSGNGNGVQIGAGISANASQGYSHTNRDLIDVNGDGLPDIADVGASTECGATSGYDLCVRLNYGYGFSN